MNNYSNKRNNLCAFQLWLSIYEDRPSPCGCDRYPWSHFLQDRRSQEVANVTNSGQKRVQMKELGLSQHRNVSIYTRLLQTPHPLKDKCTLAYHESIILLVLFTDTVTQAWSHIDRRSIREPACQSCLD